MNPGHLLVPGWGGYTCFPVSRSHNFYYYTLFYFICQYSFLLFISVYSSAMRWFEWESVLQACLHKQFFIQTCIWWTHHASCFHEYGNKKMEWPVTYPALYTAFSIDIFFSPFIILLDLLYLPAGWDGMRGSALILRTKEMRWDSVFRIERMLVSIDRQLQL